MNWDPDFLYFPDCGDGVLIMRKKQQAVVMFLERVGMMIAGSLQR